MNTICQYRAYLCGGAQCGPHSLPALLAHLEYTLWAAEVAHCVEVRVGGCQGQCAHGPNLMVYPGGYRYAALTPDRINQIVAQHFGAQQPVVALLHVPDP